MAISEEKEEKNWDNHSLLFAATQASLNINPSKNLVSLGNLHVWPGCSWSLGTLMAAVWDCQMAAPYSCVACLC